MNLDDNEGVEELRGDHVRREGSSWILEDNADDVISNVPFSRELLLVS